MSHRGGRDTGRYSEYLNYHTAGFRPATEGHLSLCARFEQLSPEPELDAAEASSHDSERPSPYTDIQRNVPFRTCDSPVVDPRGDFLLGPRWPNVFDDSSHAELHGPQSLIVAARRRRQCRFLVASDRFLGRKRTRRPRGGE